MNIPHSFLNMDSCRWFNPDSGAGGYGFGSWPGHLAVNAYDPSKVEPYTGRLPGRDWLRDQQFAKMKILAEKYRTQIMVILQCARRRGSLIHIFAVVRHWWAQLD